MRKIAQKIVFVATMNSIALRTRIWEDTNAYPKPGFAMVRLIAALAKMNRLKCAASQLCQHVRKERFSARMADVFMLLGNAIMMMTAWMGAMK